MALPGDVTKLPRSMSLRAEYSDMVPIIIHKSSLLDYPIETAEEGHITSSPLSQTGYVQFCLWPIWHWNNNT